MKCICGVSDTMEWEMAAIVINALGEFAWSLEFGVEFLPLLLTSLSLSRFSPSFPLPTAAFSPQQPSPIRHWPRDGADQGDLQTPSE